MLAKILVTTLLGSSLLAAMPPPADPVPAPAPGLPSFGAPLDITNPFAPFRPGATKVFSGRRPGVRTIDVENHLEETRTFVWRGAPVQCRVFEQKEFENGALAEITLNYLAQGDDGSVYSFGEVAQPYEAGVATGVEEDSWLVGPVQADDPQGVQSVENPAMYMPAELPVGAVFNQENFPGGSETLVVVMVGAEVHTPAGNFSQAVVVAETETEEAEPGEHRWLVPGVGTVKVAGRDAGHALIAGSLVEHDLPLAPGRSGRRQPTHR